ncbi:Aspartate--tRNA ligase [Eumeta japonica]|uniref:Aspartate--tRNA ligase n=1 Tax=Eumeta variegata TaxID=151549 RepID=A0A4C1XM92_EUMVA|nr:Aspartate--tRNA ligase [Eumeta japonica]
MVTADSQPEFTTLSIEMSFADQDAVIGLVEDMLRSVYPMSMPDGAFPRISYKDALHTYGSPTPDCSFDLKLTEISNYFKERLTDSSFGAFMLLYPKNVGELTVSTKDSITKITKQYQDVTISRNLTKLNHGNLEEIKQIINDYSFFLAYGDSEKTNPSLSISTQTARLIQGRPQRRSSYSLGLGCLSLWSDHRLRQIGVVTHTDADHTPSLLDLLLTSYPDSYKVSVNAPLGSSDYCLVRTLGEVRMVLRDELKEKKVLKENVLSPLWVVDLPMFVKEKDDIIKFYGQPFPKPHADDTLNVRAMSFDLVIKGKKFGSGAVRANESQLVTRQLRVLRATETVAPHFIKTLNSGCPPHAGISIGVDRLVAFSCQAGSIRDVIAFPKIKGGKDLVTGAPFHLRRRQRSDDDISEPIAKVMKISQSNK